MGMVNHLPLTVEWQKHVETQTYNVLGDRCIHEGVGSNMWESLDRTSVVYRETVLAHKLPQQQLKLAIQRFDQDKWSTTILQIMDNTTAVA